MWFSLQLEVGDPRFPRWAGGTDQWDWGKNLLLGNIFAKNSMEMNKIGLGDMCLVPLLDLPIVEVFL